MAKKKKRIKPKEKNVRWLHIMAIALLVFAVYSNAVFDDFAYDDKVLIRDNDFVKEWSNLPLLLSPVDYYRLARDDNYIPVTTFSFFVDYALFGLSPAGFHLTNIIVHILNSILLYIVVALAMKKRRAALLCALFFAAHPVHTESVTWVAGRTDLLSAFFFLTALLLHIRSESATDREKTYFYLGALTAFSVSLFAKEMSVTLLPVIVLYDACLGGERVRPWTRDRLLRYTGYLVVTILFVAGKMISFSKGLEITNYPGGSLYASILTMTRAVVFYIRMLVVPVNLSISHVFPVSISLLEPRVLLSVLIILALLATAVAIRRRYREVTFSIGYFFVTLLPVSHLIPIQGGVVAERYLYIPSIGFAVLLAVLVDRLLAPGRQKYAIVIPAAILTLYAVGTVKRNADWNDETTLWSKTIELYPGNGAAYLYRANTLWEKGRYAEAIPDYSKAIEITPGETEAYISRGVSYSMLGDLDAGIADFSKAIEIDSSNVKGYYNRGIAYSDKGLFGEAVSDFDRVITLAPDYVEAYNHRGIAYSKMGSYSEAIRDFTRTIELKPDYAAAYQNRGLVYRFLEREELAESDEAKARQLGRSSGSGP